MYSNTMRTLSDVPALPLKNWRFSVVLLGIYLISFNLWVHLPEEIVAVSAIVIAGGLTAGLIYAGRGGCFVNGWDRVFHAAVILDLLVEGLWIEHTGDMGFYWCAIGFAVVIGGYRWIQQTRPGIAGETDRGVACPPNNSPSSSGTASTVP